MECQECIKLTEENKVLRQLFEDALNYGFETWIMDRARKLMLGQSK